jgi:calcineurin-like phosphoesterase family protein
LVTAGKLGLANSMSNIWFTSDTHFGHKKIIQYCDRPYDSVEEMDAELIDNWNQVVKPTDEVYFLGDFSLSFKNVRQVVPLLNGTKHLVAGNHDLCHSSNSGAGAYRKRYVDVGFEDVCESLYLSVGGQRVLCHHMPFFDLKDPDQRFPEHKPHNQGGWLLHGHVHQRWKIKGRQINVGVDVWDFYPVSISVIEQLIARSDVSSVS